MSLLNDYNQNMGGEDSQIADPADSRRKRDEVERQIAITESDLKKVLRERTDLESEQRRLKKEEERIRVERDALNEKLKKIQDNQRLLEEEIRGFKKKLKTLV
ncbi:MAG: hypothetical protein A3J76_00805 [Candidatus Moranbacteria bacterium RBG_13_45_13]|nr:MAG: hypothetical protein A3J76_00805 [Candidatus Moranbacteria bacterium RBG_13_45_13]